MHFLFAIINSDLKKGAKQIMLLLLSSANTIQKCLIKLSEQDI